MECERYSQRGFFEGQWKSLCDHSTCEKLQVSPDSYCFCINCHLSRDANHNAILSQNGASYDCFRRALLQADLTIESNGDQKACGTLSICPVQQEFFLLQRVLRETGLPPTVDRRDDPRCPAGNEITIVYLAELQESQAPFFEGNRQSPGSFLLLLTISWVSRKQSADDPSFFSLLVHTAITADAGGQTFLDSFDPPRRVTYVINHLDGSGTDGLRYEGEKLVTFDLECPMASSPKLSRRTDNKLLTRMMCAASGVQHPVTLALLPQHGMAVYDNMYEAMPNITVHTRPATGMTSQWLESLVENYLAQEAMKPYDKVVVKPFGPLWNCCKGVSFHDVHDVNSIIEAVLKLESRIDRNDGILLDSFHRVFKPSPLTNIGRHAFNPEGRDLSFRIRAIVCRTPQNGARMTQVFTGVANGGAPFGGSETIGTSLDVTLQRWGLTDPLQRQEVADNMKQSSERLMLTLIKLEEKLSAEERGGVAAQTEMIGLDFILTSMNGIITPLVIEVNAHDCLYASSLYEASNREARGQATRTLVQTMIARSQRFLMKNKVVLVLGSGGFTNRTLWKDAQDFGVKIVLVDSNLDHFAREHVHRFLSYNLSDHTRDREHADVIARRVKADVERVHGCLAGGADCVPLAALVAEGLGLTHAPSYNSAVGATKGLIMKALGGNYWPPHHSIPYLYASPSVRVTSPEDLVHAVKQVPLPAVLRLEHDLATGVARHVKTLQEARAFMQQAQNALLYDKDTSDVELGPAHAFVLTSSLEGTDHDVCIVVFESQIMAAFVSDRGPPRLPSYSETTAAMPSVLCKEQERQLLSAARACCSKLSLSNGVFNVQMTMTVYGPRLVGLRADMAALRFLREWVRAIYDVDLLHLALMTACGVRAEAPNSLVQGYGSQQARQDRGQLMGILLYPSRHRQALSTTATAGHLQRLHDKGGVIFRQLADSFEGDPAHESSVLEEALGSVAVRAPTVQVARAKLTGLCGGLGLETEQSMTEMLQDFLTFW